MFDFYFVGVKKDKNALELGLWQYRRNLSSPKAWKWKIQPPVNRGCPFNKEVYMISPIFL